MNPRKIREDLGRARTCIQRRDLARAVYLFSNSLKDLGAQQTPMDLRGDFRTALADICADPGYRKFYNQPQAFQPGKERELLAFFNNFYAQLTGVAEEEDYETALQRKLNLDRRINDGKAFIAQNKFTEADESFADALNYYRDEIAAFGIMARAMMDAGQYVRALGYIKQGLRHKKDSPDLIKLGEECARNRNNAQ